MTDSDAMLSRRSVLAWGGAMASGAALAGALCAPGAAAADAPVAATPGSAGSPGAATAAAVELFMRLHASAEDGEVPWYYTGRIYAIRDRAAPVHLFNFEGTEVYWVTRVGREEWTTLSSTLTFFRDVTTGAYLDAFTNPLTGATVPVAPNVLRSRAGEPSRFSPRGYDLGPADRIPWAIEAQSNGGTAWLVTSRYLARAPQPWLEVQTMMAAEAEIRDASRANVAATFSSTYVAPWLRWMQMGDAPGHLLWHASGRKLASWGELPEAYAARARRLKPEHFIRP